GFQNDLRLDLHGPQRRGAVGGEVGVAGPGGDDNHPPLLEMPYGPTPYVGLGHLSDLDGGEHAGVDLEPLQHVLKSQRVDHRGQPPHVIAGDPVDTVGGAGEPAVDIPTPDHQGDLHPQGVDLLDLVGDGADDLELEAGRPRAHEGFAGELQEDPA